MISPYRQLVWATEVVKCYVCLCEHGRTIPQLLCPRRFFRVSLHVALLCSGLTLLIIGAEVHYCFIFSPSQPLSFFVVKCDCLFCGAHPSSSLQQWSPGEAGVGKGWCCFRAWLEGWRLQASVNREFYLLFPSFADPMLW